MKVSRICDLTLTDMVSPHVSPSMIFRGRPDYLEPLRAMVNCLKLRHTGFGGRGLGVAFTMSDLLVFSF